MQEKGLSIRPRRRHQAESIDESSSAGVGAANRGAILIGFTLKPDCASVQTGQRGTGMRRRGRFA
jgi:hypothetical protein